MKINMPVTDKEVQMKDGTILVTRTNLKGIITYANDAFVEISGYTYNELVGHNHNMVRHPDMPAIAFQDLWESNKKGVPWTAPVKNRTKAGDYYWVEANVTPVYKNGSVVEYLSVRYAPSREQIDTADRLYRELNNTKPTTIRPTGVAKLVKNIKEMSINKKALIVAILFLLPNICLMVKSYQAQDMLHLGGVALLSLVAVIFGYSIVSGLLKTLASSQDVFKKIADEQFRNVIDLDRGDQIGDFLRDLYSMQVKLNADLAFSKQVGAESLRIKQALDNVNSSVMVSNNNLEIIYMNNTVLDMFKNAEADIRTQLPNFDSSKLLGANIDQFHKNPSMQREMLANLRSTHKAELKLGGRTLAFVANPVLDNDQDRIGIVVEWLDRTAEVKIQNEIETLVDAVKAGDLSNRLELADKSGFFEKLSEGINELTDGIDAAFSEINGAMQSLATGDLSNKITADYNGVYGECKDNINGTIDKLAEIVGQVRESSDFINNASREIASGNNNLSERVETQASSLEETASSMEELTSTVKNNADNAQQANVVSTKARGLAEKGGGIVTSAVNAMSEINESSNKISAIIGVIDEIAFQTNLLALNASVEAARAGEQGRGFSVVATEVRNLAQRSAAAAQESKTLIQTSIQKVRAGTEFVNETGSALTEIVGSVKQVGDIISEIAAASLEQSQGIEQVNQAVAQMDEITQQNAALAEEASAASVSMSDQSETMTGLLGFFQTPHNAVNVKKAVIAPPVSIASTSTISNTAAPTKTATPRVVASNEENDEWGEF